MLKKLIKNFSGLTVVETIVAMAVFAIAGTMALGIYTQTQSLQRKASDLQRVLSDSRYILEVIAREVRLSTIDYETHGWYPRPAYFLALLDQENKRLRFRINAGKIQLCYDAACGIEDVDTGDWQDISSESLEAYRLSIYLSPRFDWEAEDQQQLVNIVIGLRTNVPAFDRQEELNLQTTVATRNYLK